MEGPTPVSALIHAATMVTAGVYLVARACVDLHARRRPRWSVVGIVGGASALFAATIACVQTDIKRVLAYSTMSQLGYMFMGEAAGGFSSGIFHLTTHAYFKALLFMCAGAVIHALAGEQDMRKMGGLRGELPQHVLALRRRWAGAGRDLPASPASGAKTRILGVVLAARADRRRHGLVCALWRRAAHGRADGLLHLPADLRRLPRCVSRRRDRRATASMATRRLAQRWRAAIRWRSVHEVGAGDDDPDGDPGRPLGRLAASTGRPGTTGLALPRAIDGHTRSGLSPPASGAVLAGASRLGLAAPSASRLPGCCYGRREPRFARAAIRWSRFCEHQASTLTRSTTRVFVRPVLAIGRVLAHRARGRLVGRWLARRRAASSARRARVCAPADRLRAQLRAGDLRRRGADPGVFTSSTRECENVWIEDYDELSDVERDPLRAAARRGRRAAVCHALVGWGWALLAALVDLALWPLLAQFRGGRRRHAMLRQRASALAAGSWRQLCPRRRRHQPLPARPECAADAGCGRRVVQCRAERRPLARSTSS